MGDTVNHSASLFGLFDSLTDRVNRLETSQRFSFPAVTSDISSPNIGDSWHNLTNKKLMFAAQIYPVATITNVTAIAGTSITYTAINNFPTGATVVVSGISPYTLNVTGTVSAASPSSFTLTSTSGSPSGSWVSGGIAQAQTTFNRKILTDIANPIYTGTAVTGTLNIDCQLGTEWYYTTTSSANFILNFRGNSSLSLDSYLQVGEAVYMTVTFTNAANNYVWTDIKIDGTSVTTKGVSGTGPLANAINELSVKIIKTASATFTTLLSMKNYQ